MPYDSLISRNDATALIPEDQVREVIKVAAEQSLALRLLRRINMGTKTSRVPVLSAAPVAYWVAGDTGLKQTTDAMWAGVDLVAEEAAVLVPVPDNVLNDSGIDIWAELRPELAAAIGRKLDQAVFAGVEKPTSWPDAIIPAAIAAGNTYEAGTATAAEGGIAEDLNQLLAVVEDDGFDPSGLALTRGLRATLRSARDTNGQKLADVSQGTYEGVPIGWAGPDVLGDARALAGDFRMGIIGLRQDVTFDLSNSAVIQDEEGAVILNAFQQDATVMRCVFRVAYAAANPVTQRETGAVGDAYPFAVLEAPGS